MGAIARPKVLQPPLAIAEGESRVVGGDRSVVKADGIVVCPAKEIDFGQCVDARRPGAIQHQEVGWRGKLWGGSRSTDILPQDDQQTRQERVGRGDEKQTKYKQNDGGGHSVASWSSVGRVRWSPAGRGGKGGV